MREDFAAILEGLRQLRESAVPLMVFGSQAHGFRTHPPLAEEAVRQFEARHRIVLPQDYRGFLIHVGNGGAGPAYGLFKLGKMDDGHEHETWTENGGFVGVLSKPFPHSGPWNDLSEEPAYDESRENDPAWEEEYHRQVDAWEDRVYWNTSNVNGAIPPGSGCAQRVGTQIENGNVTTENSATACEKCCQNLWGDTEPPDSERVLACRDACLKQLTH
jgi:hypothetical protein